MLVLPQATEIRQKQHEELVTLIARNPAATELLKLAVNEFHAPKLHKAAPKAELEQTTVSTSVWVEITTAPTVGVGGTKYAQLQSLQADPLIKPLTSKPRKTTQGSADALLIGSPVAD